MLHNVLRAPTAVRAGWANAIGVCHAIAAVVMFVEAMVIMAVPMGAVLPQMIVDAPSGPYGPIVTTETALRIRVSFLVALFLALASIDHTICTAIWQCARSGFDYYLFEKRANPLRWVEYSISASLMVVLILSLSGSRDVMLQLVAATATAVCMLLGLCIEASDDKSTKIALFVVASISAMVPWIVVLFNFIRQASQIFAFVWAATVGTFVAFALFAVNMLVTGIMFRHLHHIGEIIYIMLSLTAKSYLAFVVWGGFRGTSAVVI